MNYESVLIVTYGRSGSTLLQGVLNAVDGCLVRGENHNLCHGLFLAHESLLRARSEHAGAEACEATNPWYGAPLLDGEAFLGDARALLRRQLLGDVDPAGVRCLGFKEIRYPEVDRLADYLSFLEKLLPRTAFVFLTRDHASVARSGWWREGDPEQVGRELTAFESVVSGWAGSRANFFHVRYADLVSHGPRVGELVAFLGGQYDRERIAAVLGTQHSYSSAPKPADVVPQPAPVPEPAPAVPVARPLQFTPVPCHELRECLLDPLPENAMSDQPQTLGGVVLPKAGMMAGASLVLRGPQGETAVQWGLPSPRVAEMYPDDVVAYNARFRVENVTGGEALELCMKTADDVVHVVARLH